MNKIDKNVALLGIDAVVVGASIGEVIGYDGRIGVFVPIEKAAPNFTDEAARNRVERNSLRLGLAPPPPAAEMGMEPMVKWWRALQEGVAQEEEEEGGGKDHGE